MRREAHPDHRYRAVASAHVAPIDAIEAALWRCLRGGNADDAIVRVVDAYEDEFERELLQAWIIAGATDTDLTTRIGIAPDMITPYRHLCCDIRVFRDKLELLRWVRNYVGSREGRLMLERAVHLDGVEAVAHLCGLPSNLDPARVNEQVMRESYFRGVGTLRNASLSSAEATAAHALLKTSSAAAAEVLKRGSSGNKDIMLKLKNRELTYKPDEIVPRGEIMN